MKEGRKNESQQCFNRRNNTVCNELTGVLLLHRRVSGKVSRYNRTRHYHRGPKPWTKILAKHSHTQFHPLDTYFSLIHIQFYGIHVESSALADCNDRTHKTRHASSRQLPGKVFDDTVSTKKRFVRFDPCPRCKTTDSTELGSGSRGCHMAGSYVKRFRGEEAIMLFA